MAPRLGTGSAPASAGSTGSFGSDASDPAFSAFTRAFQRLITGDGRSWVFCDVLDSSNSLARRVLSEYRDRGLVPPDCGFLAWEQTAGRGRQQRVWQSARGKGLYMSLLYPELDSWASVALPLLTPLVVARVSDGLIASPVRIKWPNDLQASGRKLAGILIEAVTTATVTHAVVGVGVNCNQTREELPAETATSLALEGVGDLDFAGLAHAIVAGLDDEVTRARPLEEIVADYRRWTIHEEGETLRCRLDGKIIEGSFVGFDDRGALLLRSQGQVLELSASEIVE